jgi:hypothetical protein
MTVTTLHRPTHRDALSLLEEAFGDGRMLTVFGRCTVEYDGRAASTLGPGDRLVVCKPDGSILVHTDEKRTPVNWQPPGSTHRASVRDGRLRLRSTRENPDETLDVRFERVEQVSVYDVNDRSDLTLRGSEEDLRRRILDDPSLVEAGFAPEATERETAAGPVDIFGEDATGRPVVVELKRRRVGPAAASQLQRYVEALEREFGDGAAVRGVLVAPSVTDRTRELLEEKGLEFVSLGPTADDADDAANDASDDAEGDEPTENATDPGGPGHADA